MKQPLIIREGTIQECVQLSANLPEFVGPPPVEEYEQRFRGVSSLILIAEWEKALAGFKVGYERDGLFYSWLGGVLPVFRRRGIAQALADRQEEWARSQSYTSITFKTRNQHKNMLIFALRNGFDIVGFKEKSQVETNRILLKKLL